MFGASLYILACSTKNRIRVRLKRLREPRYMLGAIAGVAYMYFAVFARITGARAGRPGRGGPAVPQAVARFGPMVGGVALLLVAGLAWLVPSSSTLFDFSEAETQFLFPAPVSRRQLLIHRLMRSQLGLLFAAMLPVFLISSPTLSAAAGFNSIPARLARGLALWVLFVTLRVFFAGVTQARQRLWSADARTRAVAWAPLVLTLAAVAAVALPLTQSFLAAPPQSPRDLIERLAQISGTGLPRMALVPFVGLIRPVFASSMSEYLPGMRDSLAVLLVAIVWVLRSDAVFERTAETPAAQRKERRTGTAAAPRVGRLGWTLPLSGRPETVFFWKNSMQTLRHASATKALPYIFPIVAFSVIGTTARLSASGSRGPAAGLAFAAVMIAGFTALLGPQTSRGDLRGDLNHLEALKTWPVKPSAVIRGEMLWPAISLTLVTWFALACGTIFSAAAFPQLTLAWRLSLSGGAMLLAPALVFAQFTVHNAAAVLFPAWVPSGNQRPRGLDAMGQRLILFGAVLLSLVVMVGPGAIAGGLVAFVFYRWIGVSVAIPAAALCLAIVAIEVLLATEALGTAFDKIDVSSVERSE